MTISVAIIVKDEELIIRRCIECVSKFADEIIIVDTGSTDRTRELAAGSSPKVKVFDSVYFGRDTHYSDFSFSVAKNEAIAICTGDWIVWWDADDFIQDEGAIAIRRLAEQNDTTRLYSFVISYGSLRFEHARMFVRKSDVKFDEAHACHEYLLTAGKVLERRNEIVVEHLPGKKGVPSNTRNLSILEKDFFERKREDQRTIFYLANAYKECGRWDESVEFYDKYLKISEWQEERFFACYYKAQVLSLTGKIDESRNACLDCIKEDYRFAEPYCLIGDLCAHRGDLERAIKWYELALATPFPEDSRLFVNRSCYSSYPKAKIDETRGKIGSGKIVEKIDSPKVDRIYRLPDDREKAILALFSLIICVKEGKSVGVVPGDEWQRDLLGLYGVVACIDGDNGAMMLESPIRLHGKHLVSWFCRSAGYLFEKWGLAKLNREYVPNGKVIVGESSSWDGWGKLVEELKSTGIDTVLVSDRTTVTDAVGAIGGAEMFVGSIGWLSQLAASMGVDSIVFWDNGSPEEEGWHVQCNIVLTNGAGLKGLDVGTVVSMIKRRIGDGDRSTVRHLEVAAR